MEIIMREKEMLLWATPTVYNSFQNNKFSIHVVDVKICNKLERHERTGGTRNSWQPGHKVEEVKVRMDDNVIWQEHMILAADVLLKKLLLHHPEREEERRKKQNVSYYVVRQSQCHKNHYLWTTSSISVPRSSLTIVFTTVLDGVCFLDAASEKRIILLQNHDYSTTAPLGVWSTNRMRTHLTKNWGISGNWQG